MRARIIYTHGQKFPGTRLTFIKDIEDTDKNQRQALFRCDCGKEVEKPISWVRHLNTISCGCYKSELMVRKNTKHLNAVRNSQTGAYRSWQAMHQRVLVASAYKNVFICDRWSGDDGFINFLSDMGPRPKSLTIERINNLGNYEPSNCKWATQHEQSQNTSQVTKVTIDDGTHSINEWCRIKGIDYVRVKSRRKKGMSLIEAITTPLDKSKQSRFKNKAIERDYHRNGTIPSNEEDIVFCYGSNNEGIHGTGSALVARNLFGAKLGVGKGLCRNSYGIPTRYLDKVTNKIITLPREEVYKHISDFCKFTEDNPELRFFVTKIGCGYAGFKEEDIVPLFRTAINCSFPDDWEALFVVVDKLHDINNMIQSTETKSDPEAPKWIRYRFYANLDDYRPITFPPPGPYWCSGSTDEYNICIAYLPPDVDIKTYWPEAVIDFEQHRESITYTDRFPKPEWWND